MRVALINCYRDFSNLGSIFAMCFESVGIKAVSCCTKGHKLRYNFRSKICKRDQMIKESESSDLVLWMQSKYTCGFKTNKRQAVFHGGSLYRLHPSQMNSLWNSIVDTTLIQTAEMLGKGAKNEKWILPPAFIGNFVPTKLDRKHLVVGHYPSIHYKKRKNLTLKGTALINNVMNDYKEFEYRYSSTPVTWLENLKRMSECDIYIESLNQGTDSMNRHDWSIAALEAAACGCIVITNFGFGEKRYLKEYGNHALLVANNESQLRKKLEKLLGLSAEELHKLKDDSREWATSVHSFKSIGNKLREALKI